MRGCSALGKTFKQADQGNVGRAASHLHASGLIFVVVALCECVCLFVGLVWVFVVAVVFQKAPIGPFWSYSHNFFPMT